MLTLPIPGKEHIRPFDAEGWEKAYKENMIGPGEVHEKPKGSTYYIQIDKSGHSLENVHYISVNSKNGQITVFATPSECERPEIIAVLPEGTAIIKVS